VTKLTSHAGRAGNDLPVDDDTTAKAGPDDRGH
jgi:hypothetical protein